MAKTKFITVATAGPTIDGREITPAQIDQMATSYSPAKYGARIWVEHYRSFMPDSPFKAYGDVLALKADTTAEGQRVLKAQVDATADLVKLSQDRQKVYWSIEMAPNFAGTGGAYLMGLAVTDSPASIGTEMLTFALKSDKTPDLVKANLFSRAIETPLEVDEPKDPGLLAKITELLSGKGKTDDSRFAQVDQAVTRLAEAVAELTKAAPGADSFATAAAVKTVSDQVTALTTRLDELTTTLGLTAASPQRPAATGGATSNQTDC